MGCQAACSMPPVPRPVLRHLIEVAQGDSRIQPLFCCFVGVRKAYDKVRRDLLVQRLAELGVHGNMLQAVVQMY